MSKIKVLAQAGLVVMALAISGCASIVEGTDQPIRVNLSPAHATCVVTREGEQLASVSSANQSIRISKSKNNLEMDCKAAGHLSESLSIESSASGWGVVGCIFIDLCITDYSTGALNKYPTQITVALTPESFKSEQERLAWGEGRRNDIQTRWDRRMKEMNTQCESAKDSEGCQKELAKLEDQRRAALEKFERQLTATKVSANAASAPAENSSTESRLNTLNDLLKRGLINKDEYDRKRREIVSDL